VLSEQLDDCPEKDAQRAKLNEEYHRSVRPGKFKSPKKSTAFSQIISNADICSDSDTSGDEDPDDRDDVTIPSSICICQAPGYFANIRKKQVPTEAKPIKSQIVIVKIAKEQGIKRKRHSHNKDN